MAALESVDGSGASPSTRTAGSYREGSMESRNSLRARVACVAATLLLGGCASAPAAPPTASGEPPQKGLEILVKAADASMPLDANGAVRIARETRCRAEFVTMETSAIARFRVWSTASQPDVEQCLQVIQKLPGVAFAEPNTTAKLLR
jgi:hypothetical protein